MDKNFIRIITESRETKAKIPVVLDFKQPIAIDDVMALASKRQFRSLKLMNIWNTIKEEFTPLLELLSETVEHFEISGGSFSVGQFRKLLQIFLPKLKTCDARVVDVSFNAGATINNEASIYPLESLRVGNAEMVKYFLGCKQLKSFEFRYKLDTDCVYGFLARQTQLEKLIIGARNVDLSRMIVVHLKEHDVEADVAEYLKRLPNLTKLRIEVHYRGFLNRIMEAICNGGKLEELYVMIRCLGPDNPLEGLENRTVKILRIHDTLDEATIWLLKIFCAVELVSLDLRQKIVGPPSCEIKCQANLLNPSNVPHETIDRIEFAPVNQPINILFSPLLVPANVQSFEAAVMKFVEKFSARIRSITIGHSNWLGNGDFNLSNSFCEGVVKALPKLAELERYNVADRGGFRLFLDSNRDIFNNLENVKLPS